MILMMALQKVDTMLIAFFAIFVITNFNTATSLQCYQCESNSTGSCWSSLGESDLKECGDQSSTLSPSTTTASPAPTSAIPSSTNPSATSTPGASSAATTASISPSSSNPTTTPTSGASSAATTASISPSSSNPTTTPTPEGSSAPTTASISPSSSNPTTTPTSEVSSAPTTTSAPASSSDTTVVTRPSTEATTITTTSAPENEQTPDPQATLDTFSAGNVRVLLKNGKDARVRRDIITRADNNTYQCAKIVYKDGATDMIKRKCIIKTETPCEEDQKQLNASVCEVCDSDGCNTSSNISFELTSMFIPFAMVFYMLWQT